jgi:hypothetical protein
LKRNRRKMWFNQGLLDTGNREVMNPFLVPPYFLPASWTNMPPKQMAEQTMKDICKLFRKAG